MARADHQQNIYRTCTQLLGEVKMKEKIKARERK
jgi:hypothetical protein